MCVCIECPSKDQSSTLYATVHAIDYFFRPEIINFSLYLEDVRLVGARINSHTRNGGPQWPGFKTRCPAFITELSTIRLSPISVLCLVYPTREIGFLEMIQIRSRPTTGYESQY